MKKNYYMEKIGEKAKKASINLDTITRRDRKSVV